MVLAYTARRCLPPLPIISRINGYAEWSARVMHRRYIYLMANDYFKQEKLVIWFSRYSCLLKYQSLLLLLSILVLQLPPHAILFLNQKSSC